MKKLFALFLVCMLLLPLCACGEVHAQPAPEPAVSEPTPTPAPEPEIQPEPEPTEPALSDYKLSELDTETLHKAIQSVIMAFYNRNPYVQYDLSVLTYEPKHSGSPKRTTYMAPEGAAYDTEHFSQCSEFCWDVYYHAFGWEDWMGARLSYDRNRFFKGDYLSTVVCAYDREYGYNDRETPLKILAEQAQIGDVILGFGDSVGNSGHVLIILGDYYGDGRTLVAHCWPVGGGTLNTDTGTDAREPNGSIVIQTIEEVLLTPNGNPNWCVATGRGGDRWYLFRPLNHPDLQNCSITPATVSRMSYPDMAIEKTADRYIYDDVTEGEDVTVTQKISNRSKEDYAPLTVVEYVPEGAVLKSASDGCTVDGNTLTWTLSVAAGKSAEISYTVTNHLKRGAELVFPAGRVDNIPSRDLTFKVGGRRLSESQLDALYTLSLGVTPELFRQTEFTDLDFVNRFYKEILGADIALPKTVNEYTSIQFKTKSVPSVENRVLTIRSSVDEKYQYLADMAIRKGLNGFNVSYGMTAKDTWVRLMEVQEDYFTPGDVFVTFGPPNSVSTTSVLKEDDIAIYIYLGNHRALSYTTSGVSLESFSTTIGTGMVRSLFAILRPTLAYDDLSAEVKKPEDVGASNAADAETLRTLAEKGETFIRLTESMTLPAADYSAVKLTVAEGKTVTLSGGDVKAKSLLLEEGAKVVSSGEGRLVLTVKDELSAVSVLSAAPGQAVRVECAFADPEIINTFDCLTNTAHYSSVASLGRKNLLSLFRILPANWTVKMHAGIIDNVSLNIPQPGTVIDLNGNRLGNMSFTGEDVTFISSSGTGKIVFRGQGSLSPALQQTNITAPDVIVEVGFTSTSSGPHSAALQVSGRLECKRIELVNGSTITETGEGKIITAQ